MLIAAMRYTIPMFLITLCSCTDRPALTADSAADQQVKKDGVIEKDRFLRPDAAADRNSNPFCDGTNRLTVNGQPIVVSQATIKVAVTNLCNTQTIFVSMTGKTQGISQELQFYLCLDKASPQDLLFKMSDLGSHMARAMASPCTDAYCILHHRQEALFTGQLSLALASTFVGVNVTLCVSASAKSPKGAFRSFQSSTEEMKLVHSCQLGADHTCNHSLMVSALYGKCNPDGSCTCLPGKQKVLASGKCQ